MTTLPLPEEVLPATGAAPRRRSWLWFAVVALLVAIYLVLWSTYASTHTGERYRFTAPGGSGTRLGAEYRVLGFTRTDRLTDADGGKPQLPEAGATFVVVDLEVVQHQVEEYFGCYVDLLGPDGRLWTGASVTVDRAVPGCTPSDVVPGTPYRFQGIYEVPVRYVDQVAGVALTDDSTADRSWVLRPPS